MLFRLPLTCCEAALERLVHGVYLREQLLLLDPDLQQEQ